MDSHRALPDLLVDVAQNRVYEARTDVRTDSDVFEQMPLNHGGNGIELCPSEIRGGDKVAADDAHAGLRRQSGDLCLERDAIAEEEVHTPAHAPSRLELRLESRDTRREGGRSACTPDSLDVEEDFDAPLGNRGRSERHDGGGNQKQLHGCADSARSVLSCSF